MTQQELIGCIVHAELRIAGTQRQLALEESQAQPTEVDQIALRTLNEMRIQRNQWRTNPVVEIGEYRRLCTNSQNQEQLIETRTQERLKHRKIAIRLRKEIEDDTNSLANWKVQLQEWGQIVPFRKEDSND